MEISFDPDKRARTLADRGLDFADAAKVFDGPVFEFDDKRFDYLSRVIRPSVCSTGGWWS